MSRKCSNCYYNCIGYIPCDDYYPLDEEIDEEEIERIIEEGRLDFTSAFQEYISEYNE